MGATGRTSRSSAVAAGAALALTGCAALSFAVADAIGLTPRAEAVSTLSWLAGWTFLAWATFVGSAVLVHLVRAAAHRRRPPLIEVVLVVATAAAVVAVICAYPPAGSGAGVG
jgi:hypothetical protein